MYSPNTHALKFPTVKLPEIPRNQSAEAHVIENYTGEVDTVVTDEGIDAGIATLSA